MDAPATALKDWVKSQYLNRHGGQHKPINWDNFEKRLIRMRPAEFSAIRAEINALQQTILNAQLTGEPVPDEEFEAWVHLQYLERGFSKSGFKGWAKFKGELISLNPNEKDAITATVKRLREPGSKYSFKSPGVISGAAPRKAALKEFRDQLEFPLDKARQEEGGVAIKDSPIEITPPAQDKLNGFTNLFPGSFQTPTSGASSTFSFGAASISQNSSATSPFIFGATPAPTSGTTAIPFVFGGSGTPTTATATTPHASRTGTGLEKDITTPKTKTAENVNEPLKQVKPPNGPAHVKLSPIPIKANLSRVSNGQANGNGSTTIANRHTKEQKLTVICAQNSTGESSEEFGDSDSANSDETDYTDEEDNEQMAQITPSGIADYLLGDHSEEASSTDAKAKDVQHAPIISEDVIEKNQDHLPQYGLLGAHVSSGARLFQNTNVPFASFVCGVQGSGKSHTTACMLENALIPVPSDQFGRLEKPLSAMVFAYDDFNGNGESFNVSEAASLASPHAQLSKHFRVKKVTVLVSPSNPAIRRIYSKLPNVTVIPFKLDPRSLNVKTILTLMAVDESSSPPLYLAQLTKILREINVQNDGGFDYRAFKKRLRLCDFNAAQENMLQLRLDLLESFLDMNGNAPQPKFRPGEITIMDMSCPFVDKNTACVLFKIGLHRYLESDVAGKMVVLDEAHKYMANVPGAKELNNELISTIRLQRHKGVRIIIAIQEPTLLTDLIALCDVTVIHRFSSPEWFSALQKHIPMANQDHKLLLEDIEALKPGTALVYSPKGIFGNDEEGGLLKGTGKLIMVRVRKRITADGGQSILAA